MTSQGLPLQQGPAHAGAMSSQESDEDYRTRVLGSLGLLCSPSDFLLDLRQTVVDASAQSIDQLEGYSKAACSPEDHAKVKEILNHGFVRFVGHMEEGMDRFEAWAHASIFSVPPGLPLVDDQGGAPPEGLREAKELAAALRRAAREVAQKEAEVERQKHEAEWRRQRVEGIREQLQRIKVLKDSLAPAQVILAEEAKVRQELEKMRALRSLLEAQAASRAKLHGGGDGREDAPAHVTPVNAGKPTVEVSAPDAGHEIAPGKENAPGALHYDLGFGLQHATSGCGLDHPASGFGLQHPASKAEPQAAGVPSSLLQ